MYVCVCVCVRACLRRACVCLYMCVRGEREMETAMECIDSFPSLFRSGDCERKLSSSRLR